MAIIFFIKNFFSIVMDFFNTKAGRIVAIVIIAIASLWYSHHNGYEAGEVHQAQVQATKYADQLREALKQREVKQTEVSVIATETKAKDKKVETVYRDKVIEIEKITEKYIEPRMSDEDFINYIEDVKAIK